MPSKDHRRPIECRLQLGMNASRQLWFTVEYGARIAMGSIEQRMLAPEAGHAPGAAAIGDARPTARQCPRGRRAKPTRIRTGSGSSS